MLRYNFRGVAHYPQQLSLALASTIVSQGSEAYFKKRELLGYCGNFTQI